MPNSGINISMLRIKQIIKIKLKIGNIRNKISKTTKTLTIPKKIKNKM